MDRYQTLGFYLRLDIDPDGATASLFDIDDAREEMPLAEATAPNADAAVLAMIDSVTFNLPREEDEDA